MKGIGGLTDYMIFELWYEITIWYDKKKRIDGLTDHMILLNGWYERTISRIIWQDKSKGIGGLTDHMIFEYKTIKDRKTRRDTDII